MFPFEGSRKDTLYTHNVYSNFEYLCKKMQWRKILSEGVLLAYSIRTLIEL